MTSVCRVFGGMGRQGIPRLGRFAARGRGLGRGLFDLGGARLVRGLGARGERDTVPLGAIGGGVQPGFSSVELCDEAVQPVGRAVKGSNRARLGRQHRGVGVGRWLLGVGALIQRGGRAVAGMLTIATAGGS